MCSFISLSRPSHLSIVICGHVDGGKSTTTRRLLFEMDGIPERELDKLTQEAERLEESSFAFASYLDSKEEEKKQGVIIACKTKEMFTDRWNFIIIDAPGYKDFLNITTGASQADAADGNFTTAIAKEYQRAGEVQ